VRKRELEMKGALSRAQSMDPMEVSLKFARRDPSVRAGPAFSLGMTSAFSP
jgi:hypothetical protein